MDHLQPDNIVHGERQRRKQAPIACPVCGVTVRPADMEQHYAIEVERLHKLHISSDAAQRAAKSVAAGHHRMSPKATAAAAAATSADVKAAGCSTSASSSSATGGGAGAAGSSSEASTSGAGAAVAGPMNPKECWSTYQRIKNNRQSRLKVKSRKRKSSDPVCPVCNEPVSDDINIHVERCLRRSNNGRHKSTTTNQAHNNGGSNATTTSTTTTTSDDDADDDDDVSIDVESAEPFEEYEWAGQTRIRASSLLQGGYGAAGIGTAIQTAAAGDEDEDLIVDGDDSHVFGAPQYGERDVILPAAMGSNNKEQTENLYLRKLVTGDCGRRAPSDEAGGTSATTRDEEDASLPKSFASSAAAGVLSADSKDHIIEALKTRLRDYEGGGGGATRNQNNQKCKCLICMDEFRQPVVSICCWHVHCEECWLRTLGARKLCPQCNMITSPTDLRRIYM